MKIINPYDGIDFKNTPRILGNTHEHIYNISQVKKAYDRGIRVFGCVNYFPSAPSVSPKHLTDEGLPSKLSKWKVPFNIWDLTFDENNEPILPENYPNIKPEDTPVKVFYYEGSIPSFEDKDGNTIYTDDLPQIANCERTNKWIDRNFSGHYDMRCNHFNLLGYLNGEATNYTYYYTQGYFENDSTKERSFYHRYSLTSFQEDCNYANLPENQQFENLIFGTANHPYYGNTNINQLREMIDNSNGVIKAIEFYNDGCWADTQIVLEWADILYKEGYRFWGVAVVDWQSDYKENAEATFNRGCNTLLIPNYDNIQSADEKARTALKTYIDGKFYACGTGLHYITNISISGSKITFSVDSNASKIVISSSKSKQSYTNVSSVDYMITYGDIYVRFEAYFYQDENDMDFIFSNPIWIENNGGNDNKMKKDLLLLL